MDERLISAVEKIADELKQIRISSWAIAHALSGEAAGEEKTVAQSLTSIATSQRWAENFTERNYVSLSEISGHLSGIADAVGEKNEDRDTHSITESLAGIDQSLRSIDTTKA